MNGGVVLAEISEKGEQMMGIAIDEAYLLALNRYAFEHGLITEEEFQKMKINIRISTIRKLDELKDR